MKILNDLDSFSKTDTVVTIGTFDGVHIGHQKIIKRLINTAKENQLNSVILTFFPHPRMVLQKDANIKLINTIDERSQILEALGLDCLYIKEFTHEFSRLSSHDFVKQILIDRLHAKKVIIGYDHRFGRNRNADINDLRNFGKQLHFKVEEISSEDVDDVSVSSTKIRSALLDGNIKKANKYLGYNFMITGTVVKGKELGRQIDFPTANITVEEDYKLIPKQGSYVVSAVIENQLVYGMMNIGTNPTVDGKKETIEVHFFNLNKNLYHQKIQVRLLHRIRDEQKFESVEALKLQLAKDEAASLQYITSQNE
ncbi:riboflavin biosynthesis protein RibF [Pseudalgibacter alginicilyticus]|uniref:Riboflavin biosynthesis protein n=1 Tax=Pseudalgibacter alginicilyticus TaxID=1736674 RepID=A0A0P0D5H5_9FLAO|nr:bifunctional riboflavin kinase/FAD synthetase [Pseudalgibacter alginicilyticus]ALJ05362.1 riboflavin biosynthesis protein RibF [Pseudalgibacter alginicilyticus]